MRILSLTIITVSLLLCGFSAAAQQAVTAVGTIVEHITAGTDNSITQPEGLLKRLMPIIDTADEDADEKRTETPRSGNNRPAGFRVQVFSDNNVRTAKSEAASKERVISARFPQYQTYVRYNAPYWRLKVGDFRTQHEANQAAEELRKAFPAYAKEIRVVPDRISLPSTSHEQ